MLSGPSTGAFTGRWTTEKCAVKAFPAYWPRVVRSPGPHQHFKWICFLMGTSGVISLPEFGRTQAHMLGSMSSIFYRSGRVLLSGFHDSPLTLRVMARYLTRSQKLVPFTAICNAAVSVLYYRKRDVKFKPYTQGLLVVITLLLYFYCLLNMIGAAYNMTMVAKKVFLW